MNATPAVAFHRYLVALLLAAVAVAFRGLLDPALGDYLPLASLYGAVALTVWLCGVGPAITAAALGYFAADYLFGDPRGIPVHPVVRETAAITLHVVTCAIIIFIGERMRRAEEALRRGELAQRLFVAIHDRTRGLRDPVEATREVAALLGRHFGVARCLYADITPDQERAVIHGGYADGVAPFEGEYPLGAFSPELTRGYLQGVTAVVHDVAEDARTRANAESFRAAAIGALIGVPLLKDGKLVALLGLLERRPRRWAPEEVALVESVAERTWFAVETARAQAALLASERALRETDRRKDEFLATLAHELRNPLAPILNAVEILRLKEPSSSALHRPREIIERQVRQLTHLVDDLLDASRITQGKVRLRLERVDVAAAVHSAVEAARPLFDNAGHEFVITMPPAPITVEADPTRLTQIILNLLNNAAKFTPASGRVELAVAEAEGQLVITVRDNGEGIDPENLARLFRMFSQVGPVHDRAHGGLGIGLALVRGFAELHGGTVAARSDGPGRGAEFVVRLPLAQAARPALATPAIAS